MLGFCKSWFYYVTLMLLLLVRMNTKLEYRVSLRLENHF